VAAAGGPVSRCTRGLLGKPERRAHIDRHAATGLAISGFDPVAYFTDSKAVPGRPELELNLKGVVWRFRSEGNRAAFQLAPDAYAPRFGGYDPVAISRDRAVPGHPLFWAITGERLYLFYRCRKPRGVSCRTEPDTRFGGAELESRGAHGCALE
jgi:hypothetical protein